VPERPSQELAELQVRLEFSKVRSGPLQPPVSLRFHDQTLLPYVVDPTPETALKAKLILRHITQRSEAAKFLMHNGMSQSTAYRMVKRLEKEFSLKEEE